MSGYLPGANELMRRLREAWVADIEALLRAIDPGLLAGRLGTGALPRGTMVYKGEYNSGGSYRPGDVVTSAGTNYLAVAASSGQPTSATAYWVPLGAGAREALYWDGAALVYDYDGVTWG